MAASADLVILPRDTEAAAEAVIARTSTGIMIRIISRIIVVHRNLITITVMVVETTGLITTDHRGVIPIGVVQTTMAIFLLVTVPTISIEIVLKQAVSTKISRIETASRKTEPPEGIVPPTLLKLRL